VAFLGQSSFEGPRRKIIRGITFFLWGAWGGKAHLTLGFCLTVRAGYRLRLQEERGESEHLVIRDIFAEKRKDIAASYLRAL